MTWLIVLICCTFCFTVALTAKYKEQLIELREKNIEDKKEYDIELITVLQENGKLQEENDLLKRELINV